MKSRKKTKYAHVGRYAVELDVELIEDETAWSPYLNLEDAYRLDEVQAADVGRRYGLITLCR